MTGPSAADGTVHRVDRQEDLPEPVPDAAFVVVDVIISSTTVVRLLEAGADYVRPFADADAARAFRAETDAFLVGEQGGESVEGFDGSPLPSLVADYPVADRPVGLLSSNGTRAMDRIGHDRDIYVGTTVNAAAVAEAVTDHEETWLVAAGRQGEVVGEDVAGVDRIAGHLEGSPPAAAALAETIRGTPTAQWLREMGYEHEIEALCEFDSIDLVPRLRDGVFVAE
ncbi:2-phosphosulfolactate phosphatase [Haloglomus litoreum]|uniref:2-phosphosulfolactate phosphatase n=1 Tax=Haloglomus litoreum TaxID=3034026 RepID=UPI0023E781FF|nr:2-phosphosulfolactate phosphatase [Haloglomus sp. DT116]